ncbi:MAG: hypothetical protein Q8M15_07685 [Bacteroidota bacterium]|nr:hypothetical protein [Bacteroidota bacterium]
MLARIYFLSGLFLVNLFFTDAMSSHEGNRLSILIKEYKQTKRESKSLHRFIRYRQKCEKKIDKRTGLKIPVFQKYNQPGKIKVPGELKHPIIYKNTITKDTNYYISQIIYYKNDIAFCKWKLAEMEKALKEKLLLSYSSSEPQKSNNKTVQNILKNDKRLYYLRKQLARKQGDLLRKINLKPFQQLLDQAQKQNSLLSAQLYNNPAMLLPPQYQLKGKVQQALPQNRAGIEPNKRLELQDKFSNATNNMDALLDSINKLQINIDSVSFKKNPYREIALKERLEKSLNWQAQKSNNYFPAILDIYFGLGFKLSPRLTPQAGIICKVGMGKDIEHIQFSQQGFGLRAGANFMFYKNALLFLNYEYAWFKANQESNNAFKAIPGLVFGLGLKGKINMQIGYDFLQYINPQKGSPWTLNFGI